MRGIHQDIPMFGVVSGRVQTLQLPRHPRGYLARVRRLRDGFAQVMIVVPKLRVEGRQGHGLVTKATCAPVDVSQPPRSYQMVQQCGVVQRHWL